MSRNLAHRITETGRRAIRDLMDRVAQDLDLAIETHGEDSLEVAEQRLILASIHCTMEEYEKALPILKSYLTICKAKLEPTSDEVFCGLNLLSNTFMGADRPEEAFSVLEEATGAVAQLVYQQRRDPLLDGLKGLADKYRFRNDSASGQRAFVLAVMMLSWCVTVYRTGHPVFAAYYPLMNSIFEKFGFGEWKWEWLVNHASQTHNDFVGLVSVLMEEGMFPAGENEVSDSDEVSQNSKESPVSGK